MANILGQTPSQEDTVGPFENPGGNLWFWRYILHWLGGLELNIFFSNVLQYQSSIWAPIFDLCLQSNRLCCFFTQQPPECPYCYFPLFCNIFWQGFNPQCSVCGIISKLLRMVNGFSIFLAKKGLIRWFHPCQLN